MKKVTLKEAPTKVPVGVRANYEYLAHPDMYLGETEEDFNSRKNILDAFNVELARQGLTLNELVMAELGIKTPNAGSNLLHSLIGRL